MHERVRLVVAAAILLEVVNACSNTSKRALPSSEATQQDSESDLAEPVDPNRLLCANCSPSAAGGETGDFIGNIDDGCQALITELERDGSHAGLNAADAVQLVERHVTVPAHFRPTRSLDRWAGASEVTGYAESLEIELDIDVTRVVVVERVPVPGSTSSNCGSAYLAVEASVSVSTSDGALSGGLEHVSGAIYYSTLGAELFGSADAASFQGTLDIGSGHEPPVDQLVADLSLYLSPDGTRGALALSVVSGIDTAGVIDLEWPVDACGPPQWPVDATAYAPLVELASQAAASHYPLTAEWAAPDAFREDDPDAPIPPGIETSLAFELDGAIESACRLGFAPVGSAGQSANVLTTTAQLSTSDGRIQGMFPGTLYIDVDANGAVSYYAFDATTVFRSEDLETELGIYGVDLFGSDCGVLFLTVRFNGVQKWGTLEVDSRPCDDTSLEPMRLGDFLSWCSGPCEYPATPHIWR